MVEWKKPDRKTSPGGFERGTEEHRSCWDCEFFCVGSVEVEKKTRSGKSYMETLLDFSNLNCSQFPDNEIPNGNEIEKLPEEEHTLADLCPRYSLCKEFRQLVTIVYTNWKGVTDTRTILPYFEGLFFGSNEWHTEPQWLLPAYDVDKNADRTFAMKDISEWKPYDYEIND